MKRHLRITETYDEAQIHKEFKIFRLINITLIKKCPSL